MKAMSRLSCILFLFGVIAHPLSAFPKNEDLFLEAESYEDEKKMAFVKAEPGVTLRNSIE